MNIVDGRMLDFLDGVRHVSRVMPLTRDAALSAIDEATDSDYALDECLSDACGHPVYVSRTRAWEFHDLGCRFEFIVRLHGIVLNIWLKD